MKIFITGGAGFLGLHLALHFSKKKYSVTLVDIADFEKSEYPKSCILINGDVRNASLMNKSLKNVDVVIHAAAALPLWKKEDVYDININGTKTMLEASIINKVKRFVYISSTAVYGVPKVHPLFEGSKLIGVGAYGESKISAEKICNEYRAKGMVISIIRPKTFVGTNRLGVFEILFDWIRDGKQIPVIGNGRNRYQLLDVDDLVEAIDRISKIKNMKLADTIFNMGSLHFETVERDLQKLFDYAYNHRNILDQNIKKARLLRTPAAPIKLALRIFEKLKLSPLYEWVYDTADKDSFVSIDRLINTLKWKPKYSNSQALIKSYQWYLENYQEIKSRPEGVTHRVGWKQGILGFFKRFL
ncbi:MAG: NAD(P)-dependent oxidoreductase [bacterium]|nr:NAD(P)-dependent oxidoreductase [bacterium]